ncbi:MAG: flagellar basal body L-ring protein FlgH [Kiloniellales bacterium]|nr:flagellar basal body L-ring protein FlgH [Kiloniellales bacterium]
MKQRFSGPENARARTLRVVAALVMVTGLSGCNLFTRLSEVGSEPALTSIRSPATLHGNQPVQMPMPAPIETVHHPNSLWRPGSRAFFKDQRANQVGDILTVNIEIDDSATLNNSTTRTRDAGESAALSAFLGYETLLSDFFPDAVNPDNLVNLESDSNSVGTGAVQRQEDIEFDLAAIVTQVLPNGNLVIGGRQEVRVNYEVRQIQMVGIVRPEDIRSDNTVPFDKIAEARIAYGGRGQLSDLQQPRYGQQIFDIIWPF